MRNHGFTLIEVIVAMTIISIMAGILVPLSYRIFESQEVDVTQARMQDLKKAMIGDLELYQLGIRSDYGYVGDNGELPELLSDLIPYLAAGYNPATYDQDAWGKNFVYTPAVEAATGRYQSASLSSSGPDRTSGTGDDLNVQIVPDEVIPTAGLMGNLGYSVTNTYNSAVTGLVYSAKVTAYRDLGGPPFDAGGCVAMNVGRVEAESYSGLTSALYDSSFSQALPVGKFIVSAELYKNATCSGVSAASSNAVVLFVSNGLEKLYVNLRFPPVIN